MRTNTTSSHGSFGNVFSFSFFEGEVLVLKKQNKERQRGDIIMGEHWPTCENRF